MSNRDLAYRYVQSLTERDEAGYTALLHPDYVNHNPFAAPGKAGSVAVFFQGFVPALPDFRVTVEDVYEDGNTLIGRFKYSGTFTHSLMGYAPTRKPIEMRSIDIWTVKDGLLAEHWDELNTLEVFMQMGAATMNAPSAQQAQPS
jgi:predicted SnoaL-like aldol condensation-catalyzing enzyme